MTLFAAESKSTATTNASDKTLNNIYIAKVDLQLQGSGRKNALLQSLIQHAPLQPHHLFHSKTYESFKKKLYSTAENEGFLNAQFSEHVVSVDLAKHAADITLHFDTGPQYYFGPVHFSESDLAPEFLNRFIQFHTGDKFTYPKITELQDNLSGTHYFEHVRIALQRENTNHFLVPINIQVTPRKKQIYRFGMGYGTDTGPRANVNWDWRPINKYGHYFSTQLRTSTVQNNILLNYTIPGNNPATEQYNIFAGLYSDNYITSPTRSLIEQIGSSYTAQQGKWFSTYMLYYHRERSQLANNPQASFVHYVLPSATWTYQDANKPILPTLGYKASLNLRAATHAFFSATNFFQADLSVTSIHRVWRRHRLMLRGELGYSAVSDLNDLPTSLFFYAGGAQSLRGYSYRALGGGRYLATGTIEFRPHIYKKWYGALFYDVGNAANQLPLPLKQSIGAGAIWETPLGPLELTVASVLSLPNHPKRIQFTMGSYL